MTSEEFIEHRTKNLRIDQRQLADIVGVSTAAVGLWEKGERRVPKPVIKLVKLLHKYPSLTGEIRTL